MDTRNDKSEQQGLAIEDALPSNWTNSQFVGYWNQNMPAPVLTTKPWP